MTGEERNPNKDIEVEGSGAAADQGGVAAGEGGVAVGRDVYGDINIGQKTLNIILQAGIQLPQTRSLAVMLETLEQSLPHLNPAQQVATETAIRNLKQSMAELPQHEQAYLQRVCRRFAKPATIFVDLPLDTYEQSGQAPIDPGELDLATVAELMSRQETIPDLDELQRRGHEINRVRLPSLREATERYPCIILLGDPGSGKTTALNHLAYELAQVNQSDGPPKLSIPLRLSEFGTGDQTVEDFIFRCWSGSLNNNHWAASELAANLEGYLAEGRLFILFDALNEMSTEGFKQRAAALRAFIEQWQATGNRFVVTCRVLDYEQELQGLQRVEVQPFSNEQIQSFLQKVLHQHWQRMWVALSGGSYETRQLLTMASNPYMLTMMVSEFVRHQGQLSANRAELMTGFTEMLLRWTRKKPHLAAIWLDEAVQREALSVVAFEMQARAGSGTAVEMRHVKKLIPDQVQTDPAYPPDPIPSPDQVLSLAAGANIIEIPVDRSTVRFYHQLLQEYFAARYLIKQDPIAMTKLWRWPWLEDEIPLWVRPMNNIDPLPAPPQTGWEETTIMATGLTAENDDELVRALIDVNPVLGGRCLHEGQARVDKVTRQALIEALLTTIGNPQVALRVRIAAGDVLGHLGDPRLGRLETIPAGKFLMPKDEDQHELNLPAYRISQFPLTYAEYSPFIEAGGYKEKQWWTESGWNAKGDRDLPYHWHDKLFNKPNHPVIGISWYECVAYCRWLSHETGRLYRLPTEAEWMKASIGVKGWRYPWGDEFNSEYANTNEGKQTVLATTPVGIYQGKSPFDVFDCTGNVWEWCSTRWKIEHPFNTQENEWQEDYLEGTQDRVCRGGSFRDPPYPCSTRFQCSYNYTTKTIGFRVASLEAISDPEIV